MFSNAVSLSRVDARLRTESLAASLAVSLLCAVAVYPHISSDAESGALGNYGVGALTLGSGFAPAQGTTTASGYVLYYSSDKFRDGNGKGNIVPGFDLNLVVEAAVLKHTWDFKVRASTSAAD